MNFSFDLISDIHRESWDNFNWEGQPTSLYCIVAGDLARDRAVIIDTLEQLSQVYHAVFYIDGNDEHKDYADDLGRSYHELTELIKHIPKVIYLQDNVVVINDIAILATNGWWTYDFDPLVSFSESVQWTGDYLGIDYDSALAYNGLGHTDAAYMVESVKKLQREKDVKSIVIVTHTVPAPWIVAHDVDLHNSPRFNTLGNSYISQLLREDTENKIKLWCFGHYHRAIDVERNDVRYVANPRGRGNTPYSNSAYYPKRITVES